MRVAVISDIHGNLEALNAVLVELKRLSVDLIYCAGDFVNPLATSVQVYQKMKVEKITMLRGNHEDYLIDYHDCLNSEVRKHLRFQPVRLVADLFSKAEIEEFRNLPLSIVLEHPSGQNLHIFHASPKSNTAGFLHHMTPEIERELLDVEAAVHLCGHWHLPQTRDWNLKKLVLAGSVGLPFQGKPEAEYVLLSFSQNKWNIEHRSAAFDSGLNTRLYKESGLFQKGGPVAWLLMDEMLTAQRRLARFFPWLRLQKYQPNTNSEFSDFAKRFLLELGTWTKIQGLLES